MPAVCGIVLNTPCSRCMFFTLCCSGKFVSSVAACVCMNLLAHARSSLMKLFCSSSVRLSGCYCHVRLLLATLWFRQSTPCYVPVLPLQFFKRCFRRDQTSDRYVSFVRALGFHVISVARASCSERETVCAITALVCICVCIHTAFTPKLPCFMEHFCCPDRHPSCFVDRLHSHTYSIDLLEQHF